MAGEVELRRVLDRQHVPPGRTLAGEPPGRGQHLVSADATVVEETAKGKRLVAVFRQRMQADRRLLTHRLQQTRANAAKTRITEPTKIFLNHEADLSPTLKATQSQLKTERKSFRTYANPVGQAGGSQAGGSQAGLRPLFREVTFSVAVLEARIAAVGQAKADPFLFRHLAGRLDGRMLDVLREDLQVNGPLTAGARGLGPTLHLNLTVAGVLSDRFARFAATCRAVGAQVGVEIPLVEACADPEAFMAARTRLRLAGLALVLDGVSHHALLLTVPMALEPDLVKLEWSPHLPEAGPALEQAVAALGGARVVLHRAETEDALSWGLAHGIRRFQGRHVDAMLAAGRIGACAQGGGCTLRQCVERASATGPGGRAGCNNPMLLDAASPSGTPSMAHA